MIHEDLRRVEILSFDCYGTLIDWETGLRMVLEELRAAHDLSAPVDALLSDWEGIQFDLLNQPWQPYRDVLQQSLAETFRRRGVELSDEEADRFAAEIGTWPPFPDAPPVLAQLKSDWGLAILSNIDDVVLRQSVSQLGVEFDELITAEQLQSYKPHTAHFEEAISRFDRPADRFLHCAFGFKYDQTPALKVGMQTVWIKRPGWIRDDEATPTYEVESMNELAELLGV
jgi:2-haloacid dehalogenase